MKYVYALLSGAAIGQLILGQDHDVLVLVVAGLTALSFERWMQS